MASPPFTFTRHGSSGARGLAGHVGHADGDAAFKAGYRHLASARRNGDAGIADVVNVARNCMAGKRSRYTPIAAVCSGGLAADCLSDRARRLGFDELRGAGVSGFSDVSWSVAAGDGFYARLPICP